MSVRKQQVDQLGKPIDEGLTVFPSGGERPNALPWIIKNYEEKGAFTKEQKQAICDRFTFEPADIEMLSLYIGNCLDVETALGFYPLNKARAVTEGKKALRKALRFVKARSPKETLQPLLKDLSGIFAQNHRTKALLATLAPSASDLQTTLEELISGADFVAIEAPLNRRTLRDARRIEVVEQCCCVWHNAGRPLSVTTDNYITDGPQRSGELIEFIQWMVRLVTAPQCTANVETLRTDIQRFRKRLEAPSFLTKEPVFGRPIVKSAD